MVHGAAPPHEVSRKPEKAKNALKKAGDDADFIAYVRTDYPLAIKEIGDLRCRLALAEVVCAAANGMKRHGIDYNAGTHAQIFWHALEAWRQASGDMK